MGAKELDSEYVSFVALSGPQYHTCIREAIWGRTSSAFQVIHISARLSFLRLDHVPTGQCLADFFLWLSDHRPDLPGMVLVNMCCPCIIEIRASVWMTGYMVSIVRDSSGANSRGQLGTAGWLEEHRVWGCLAWAQVLTRSLTGSWSHQWSLSLEVLAYHPQNDMQMLPGYFGKVRVGSCFSF